MNIKNEKILSKALTFLLRHKLEEENIPHVNGWANIDDVIDFVNKKHPDLSITQNDIEELISKDVRNRFRFNSDGFICANYGHSLNVNPIFIENPEPQPPKYLYFIAKKSLEDITLNEGFQNLNKKHQYLYESKEVAIHDKEDNTNISLFIVDTSKTKEIEFEQTESGIWITEDRINPESITVVNRSFKQKNRIKP